MMKDGPGDPSSPTHPAEGQGGTRVRAARPRRYAIRIRERLEPGRSEWFEGLDLTSGRQGATSLSGVFPDQAALHGVIARIRDLNLTLLSVELVEEDQNRKEDERSRQ